MTEERNNSGQFRPGNPGRPQGAPNKVTQLQREFIQSLLDNQQDKITEELGKLKGKDYLNVIIALLEYAMPKLTRAELTGAEGTSISVPKIIFQPAPNCNQLNET